jgi:hypothetical protein
LRAASAVAYVGAHELLLQLRAARGDGSYEKRLLRFTTPDVLIIDDLGLRGLAQDEPADQYEIVRRRYEHGSTIITSNRAIEEWPPMFGNPLLASAAMDRLLHHAHVLVIEGDSYRNPPPTRKKGAGSSRGGCSVMPRLDRSTPEEPTESVPCSLPSPIRCHDVGDEALKVGMLLPVLLQPRRRQRSPVLHLAPEGGCHDGTHGKRNVLHPS